MPDSALDRIASAIARIEAAALPAAVPARDEALRAEVAATLADLDALIAAHDG